jgi:hypothetical protein
VKRQLRQIATLLCGAAEAVPFPVNVKVKSSGQECPLHMIKSNWNYRSRSIRRRRVARALDLVGIKQHSWVPRPSCSLRRAGVGNACAGGLITPRYVTNPIAQAALPPTLAKSARMGHPQWNWRTQTSSNVGHPSKIDHSGSSGEHYCSHLFDPDLVKAI